MRKAWPALAIGTIVSMTRLARAEATSLPLELEWTAPPVCPDANAVRHRIETIVHGPLTARSNAVAHGRIETTDDGRFRLAVTVRTGGVADAREIDSASCAMLAEAFAVVVALAIDSTKTGGASEESPPADTSPPQAIAPSSPTASGPGESTVTPPDHAPPDSPPPERRPTPSDTRAGVKVGLGLGGSVVWGALPEPSLGLVASAGVRIDRLRFGLLGTLASGQRASFDRSAGATIDMVEGGAYSAYMVPIDMFALGPCANLEATYVRVEGFGIREPKASSAVWATPVLGGRLEARAAPWLVVLARADLLFPIDAPRIALGTTTDTVQLHSPAPVAPRLTLGAEIILP